jgi:hypothetical protein
LVLFLTVAAAYHLGACALAALSAWEWWWWWSTASFGAFDAFHCDDGVSY